MLTSLFLGLLEYFPTTLQISYCVTAFAYLLKDILWLRFTLIVSASLVIAYNYIDALQTNLNEVYWHALFILINVLQLIMMMRDVSGARLNAAEKEIYIQIFPSLTPADFHKLIKAGKLISYSKDTVLTREGFPINKLYLIHRGTVSVTKAGSHIADLGKNAFIGEMAFVTNRMASATVTVSRDSKIFTWEFHHLQAIMKGNSKMQNNFHASLGTDMAKKLVVPS